MSSVRTLPPSRAPNSHVAKKEEDAQRRAARVKEVLVGIFPEKPHVFDQVDFEAGNGEHNGRYHIKTRFGFKETDFTDLGLHYNQDFIVAPEEINGRRTDLSVITVNADRMDWALQQSLGDDKPLFPDNGRRL